MIEKREFDGLYVCNPGVDIPEHFWARIAGGHYVDTLEAEDLAKKAQVVMRLQFWKGFALGMACGMIIAAIICALVPLAP